MVGTSPTSESMPLRVLSFESRRAAEMQSLIERHGGLATIAPSMREVPLEENASAFSFGEALLAGKIDVLVFMTGVGAAALMEILTTRWPQDALLAAMTKCAVVVRGPKPTAVLREWGLRIDHRAPEPNTWRELLATLDAGVELAGRRIAIQEYGKPSNDLYQELMKRGASVLPVPIYRWELPEDTEPLRNAVRDTIDGKFDAILFTSAQQFHNVCSVAAETGQVEEWLAATNRCVVVSIGPTATETLVDGGLSVDVQPTHPKMGTLVREAIEAVPRLLPLKRSLESGSL